jgi:hypothetical protein
LNAFPVASDEGFFFGAGPALDFQFEGQGAFTGLEFALPDQLKRFSHGRVADFPCVVLLHAYVDAVGVTTVIGAIGATQEIDVKGLHGSRRTFSCL